MKEKLNRKSPKVLSPSIPTRDSKVESKWDQDIDLDFQRILDEVSERRTKKKPAGSVKKVKVNEPTPKAREVKGKAPAKSKTKKGK